MGLLTKQDIDNFYTNYKDQDVVFTNSISTLVGLQPKHIYLKFKDVQRPCIIYSSSMTQAKVIASLPNDILQQIKQESNINLRFAIKNEDKKNDSLFFFVKCKTVDVSPYKPEQNLYVIQFEYTSKPSETLIIMLGRLLEAKKNSAERREERIIVDKTNINKIGLTTSTVQLIIDNIPRPGIIRDLSFGGTKILLAGNAKFLNGKAVRLEIIHKDYGRLILLGKTIRAEALVDRKDIVALAIQFDNKQISVEYNLVINEYLKSQKIINKMKTNIDKKKMEEKAASK